VPSPPDTLLVITGTTGALIAAYSARGLSQTLDPIDAASVTARTVNGALIDLSPTQFRKFKSQVSCTDVEGPALDGIWPGMVVSVDCVAELGYPTSSGTPAREIVPGSERVNATWTYYRPRLTMLVTNTSVSLDEYGRAVQWTLDLEEQ
jgi:hypothetical protein